MNRLFYLAIVLLWCALVPSRSMARVITVGAEGDVRMISEAARIAVDGDIVEIASGEWHGDVAVWMQKNLTIRGKGARPVLFADGKESEGKAIWVIRNGSFLIENIEFRGSRVSDGNGAGIRFEKGRLVVRSCAFRDNQTGILTSNNENAELIIEDSLFAEAPKQTTPLPHLLYAGRIALLEISGSRFHAGHIGHLIKSRARKSNIRYNLIVDGSTGEASYEVDLPNGGQATLIGNVIMQSAATANPVMLAYGAEGNAWPDSQLILSHNTLISEGISPAWFIRAWRKRLPSNVQLHTFNNLFAGVGLFDYGLPGTHEGNVPVLKGSFAGIDTLDFRLDESSWFRRPVAPPSIGRAELVPSAEFSPPIGTRKLPELETWLPGAFQ